MSLAEYVPTAWTDYADSPDLEASFLNHIELGIEAVTDELIAFEAWADLHYQPVSAELTAIAGLSSAGYVKRTGPGTYVTVASIPQADVAGGPFLPLAAGAANVLTGPIYSGGVLTNIPAAPLNLVNGAQGAMKTQLNLVNTAGFPGAGSAIDFYTYDNSGGVTPGARIGAVDDNWSASFSIWTKVPGAAGNPLVERLKISNVGAVTLSALGAGFVRSSSAGLLSSSALVAGDLPGTIASDTTGSAAKWATGRTLTIGATGKAVDGSTNVSWSLAEIGAAPAFTSGAAGLVWATPAATAGVPSLRALVASDIPALDASKVASGTLPDARIASAATWNAKLATVTADSTSRAANTFYAAPNGSAGAAGFRLIASADLPATIAANTTGSAAKWTTARTVTIGSTGKAVDGSSNVSWSLAEIGAASASSLANYLPLASGSVHAPGSYTASSPTLGIGDAQYGLSAIGSNLYLHAGSGGRVVSTRDLQSNGAVFAATTLSWAGGVLRDYTANASIGALYGISTTPDSQTHSLAWTKNGSSAALNGSTQVSLQISGMDKLTAYSGYMQPSVPVYMPDLSIWGTARSGDGGRWLYYAGGGTGGISTGTTTAAIDRYQYAGFAGFVVGNTEFYGNTISHDGTPSQYSIVAGKAGGSISFHVGDPVLVGSNYRAPKVGSWTNTGLSITGALSTSTSLAWNGGILRDHYADFNYFALYGSTVGSYGNNYTVAGSKNGQISWLGGTVSSGLAVNGAGIATATSAGLAVTGALSATTTLGWGAGAAIGSSDNVVQGYNGSGNSSIGGAVAMSAWRRSGFYAFSTPTDAPNSSNNWTHLIHSQGADWAAGSQYTFQIASSFSGGSNTSWGAETYAMRVVTGGTPQPWRTLWHSGNLTGSTLPGGPYLPKAGTTGDIGIPISNAYVASASNLAFFGRTSYWTGNPVTSIGLTFDGSTAWLRSPTVRIMGSSYVVADFTDSAIQLGANTSIAGSMSSTSISTGEATIGSMTQVASRFWSTSSVLPVMAANTWCFLVCDFTDGSNVMWTTNASQTVSIRSGGSTYTTPVNTTLTDGGTNFFANYRTMILIGPTVSTSSQCSVIVW